MKPLALALVLTLALIGCDEFQSPTEPPGAHNWVEVEVSVRGEPIAVERASVHVRDLETEETSGTIVTGSDGIAGPIPWNSRLETALVSADCRSVCSHFFEDVQEELIRPICRTESEFGTVCKISLKVDR